MHRPGCAPTSYFYLALRRTSEAFPFSGSRMTAVASATTSGMFRSVGRCIARPARSFSASGVRPVLSE